MDSGVVGYRREGRSALLPPRRSKTRAGACTCTGVHECQELGCSGTPKKRRRSRRIRYSSLRPEEGEKLEHWSPNGRQVVVVMIFLFRRGCPLQERQPKSPQN